MLQKTLYERSSRTALQYVSYPFPALIRKRFVRIDSRLSFAKRCHRFFQKLKLVNVAAAHFTSYEMQLHI